MWEIPVRRPQPRDRKAIGLGDLDPGGHDMLRAALTLPRCGLDVLQSQAYTGLRALWPWSAR